MNEDERKEIEHPLSDRPVTVIVSDLHIGGGKADKGDDHVDHGEPLIRFFHELPKRVDVQAKSIEVVINGDFLEFAQTAADKYSMATADGHWCSEEESLAKADVIIKGNCGIWTAMREFQSAGGLVTVAAGNHDVDLAWGSVRAALSKVAGPLAYAIGKETGLSDTEGHFALHMATPTIRRIDSNSGMIPFFLGLTAPPDWRCARGPCLW